MKTTMMDLMFPSLGEAVVGLEGWRFQVALDEARSRVPAGAGLRRFLGELDKVCFEQSQLLDAIPVEEPPDGWPPLRLT